MTAAEALRTFPFEGLNHALGSRELLKQHLEARDACQLEAFEHALALAGESASLAFYAEHGWLDSLRAGLIALLEFLDEEPELAQYLLVHSAQASDGVLARRREALDRIAVLVDDERAPARGYPPSLTAHAVASGVLGVLSGHLSQPQPAPLAELAGALMSFIALPFLGVRAARRELARRDPAAYAQHAAHGVDVLKNSAGRVNARASLVLGVIAAEPGLNSRAVAGRARIKDDGQASRLLSRLARLGLIQNERNPESRFGAKAWTVTASGERVRVAIEREAATPEPSSSFGLPPEFAGRLDDRAVWMLRVIADQPWLRSSEVTARAGLHDENQANTLLDGLAGLGLAVREREAHGRGTPNVWRLTSSGERLDRAIGRDAPAVPRSRALDLMYDSGRRLSERDLSVLRVIGAEPVLSNVGIAQRVGITDENTASQLLARLARRGLVANARNGGKFNAWHLSLAGEDLERAIWDETPASDQRRLALSLLRDRDGRLNHRVVSVLSAIGAEPELSNNEISERVGIEAKGHASTLLARLARFGLIENLMVDPLPFEANAWQLTPSGIALVTAITQPLVPLCTEPAESE